VKPLIIGIAGGSGSGKSTVARKVAEQLQASSVATIDMDAYYRNFAHLPMEERRRINWDHPESFDLERLASDLGRLAAGEAIVRRRHHVGQPGELAERRKHADLCPEPEAGQSNVIVSRTREP
jgi:uridine kinase